MKPSGTWTLILGIFTMLVGGVFAMMALDEAGRYSTLTANGNPFANVAGNSFVYLAGIAALGLIVGAALIVVGSSMKEVLTAGTRKGSVVWDGGQWVTAASWDAVQASR